jgi:hypothetical protein
MPEPEPARAESGMDSLADDADAGDEGDTEG